MGKKRRTKKQKIKAALRRRETIGLMKVEDKKAGKVGKVGVRGKKVAERQEESLFLYDPALIKKSLLKTTYISLVILAVIFGLYWIMKSGGFGDLGEYVKF